MGKGGGALNGWIKEFTALVFTQTIQAFIYAIVISIILFGMVNVGNVSNDDNNAALGLMATFALLSVFKVEGMAKKIFGVSDTKASPGNAMKSIAKTAIAAKLGKRVLDNAGKVTGGIRSINKSRQDNLKAKKRLDEDMKDNGFERDSTGKVNYVGKASNNSGGGANGASNSRGAPRNMAGSGDAGGVGNDGNSVAASDQRRMRAALRNYEDKAAEIKKARNEGIKNICSGLTETVTSGFGAATGAVLGGADGDIDGLLNGIMAGAGVGDTIGQSAVNAVDKAAQFIKRNNKAQSGISNKELKRSIDSYKSALSNVNVNHNATSVDEI